MLQQALQRTAGQVHDRERPRLVMMTKPYQRRPDPHSVRRPAQPPLIANRKASQPEPVSTSRGLPPDELGAPTILPAGGSNAIGHMLGLLGDEWNLSIIRAALTGATHYNQFLARLPISNSVLTNRLRVLVDTGLLVKRENPTERERTEYFPTPRSRSLWPVMLPMWAWERDWVTDRRDRMPAMKHRACGQEFTPVLRCRKCCSTVTDSDVSFKLGPSGAWERCVPVVATRRRQDRPGLYAEMMNVFGNRWAAALLVAAFLGTTRFSDFRTQLGAPSGSLAKRLQTFVSIGVLKTSPVVAPPDHTGPQRSEYLLTDKGRALFPILVGALNWAHRWFRAPDGPATVLLHKGCGAPLDAELACDRCTTSIESGVLWVRPEAHGTAGPTALKSDQR